MSDLLTAAASEDNSLRRCMNDLITITALPAIWTGGDIPLIGNTLLDALNAILGVDFLYLRLTSPHGHDDFETARLLHIGTFSTANKFGERLSAEFGEVVSDWPLSAKLQLGSTAFFTVLVQLGLHRTTGVLVAGSRSPTFPTEQELLILNIAANQVAMVANETLRLLEQSNLTSEADSRVAERTTELGAANAALSKEIAERQKTEAVLRRSELTSRRIVDSMSGLVAILSSTGVVEAANGRLTEYCGINPEQLGPWGTNECIHPDDRQDDDFERFVSSIQNRENFDYETRIRRHDGVYRWFQVRGVPFLAAPGSISRWYVFLTDIDHRKRAEEARAANASELNKIINAIPVMAWSTLPDGTADFFNEHFLAFLGITAEQAYGWGWTAALHPEDVGNLTTVWQALLTSGRPGETEARLRRSDGEYRWFLFRANPIYAEDGSITRWYGTNTDIDDRKRTEEELRRSAIILAQGQRLTETGSVWWKPSSQEILWSEEAYRIAGYPDTQKPSIDLILDRCHPEDLLLVRDMVTRAAQEGANMELEHRLLMPDGKVKYVRVVLQNIGPDPSAPEFIGAVTDITARKIAEERLRRSEILLAEGQRLSLTGTFSWQVDTDEITFSEELNRIFGFASGTVVDFDRITERVYEADLPQLAEKMADVRLGVDNPEYETRLNLDDGLKHLRVVGRIIRHLDGTTECVGAIQDVSAQRVAEEARDKLRSELTQFARVISLSTMAASIAHEVSQPLSGIITNASTSVRMLSLTPPNVDGALETARRTIRDGNRAADVITRLRALFKRGAATIEPVDLNDAAREVIALMANDMQRHRILLRSELSESLPLVGGDRVQLQQVIMNLLRNSIDAIGMTSRQRRDIIVRTEIGGDGAVRLSVEDTGCGIETAETDRLFDAFHTTKPDGMGIGLSVSRSIIEAHGGEIWARSNNESGATFGFSIPSLRGGVRNDDPVARQAERS